MGARSKLGEKFLADLYEHWQQHGAEVIERVCRDDPGTYLKIIASVIPKEVTLNVEFRDQLAAFLDSMQDITPAPITAFARHRHAGPDGVAR